MSNSIMSEVILAKPAPRLSNMMSFVAFAENVGGPIERIEPCQPRAIIIICLDNDVLLTSGNNAPTSYTSFIAGPGCGPVISSHKGTLSCIEIDVAPWAMPILLGSAIKSQEVIDLSVFFGLSVDVLRDRLATASDWSSRFAAVEWFLEQRVLASRHEVKPEIIWAWNQLQRTNGQVSISELASRIGWSGRHFAQRFLQETGVKPKEAARRLRFDCARRMVLNTSIPLVDVAAANGYSDQSHMTREFSQFTSCPPAILRTTQFPDALGTPSTVADRRPN